MPAKLGRKGGVGVAGAAIAASMLVAACSSSSKPAATTGSTTPTSAGQSATSAGGQAATGTPIKVGAMFDLTGPFAALGAPMQKTFQMELDQINAAGGINGHPLKADIKDSQTSNDQAVSLTRSFVNDGDQVIFGPTAGGACQAASAVSGPARVVQYCFSGAPFTWTQYLFSANFPPVQNLGGLPAKFFAAQGWKKVACIQTADASGDSYSKSLAAEAPKFGIQVVDNESFQPGATDVTPQLTKIRSANPDAVFACVSGTNLIPVLQGMVQLGMTQPVFGGSGSTTFPVAKAAASTIPKGGLYSVGNWVFMPDQIPDSYPGKSQVQNFVQSYTQRYGSPPDVVSATVADAVQIVAKVMKQGATTGTDIAKGIEGISGYQGITSSYTFSPTNHRGTDIQPVIVQWTSQGTFKLYKVLDMQGLTS